MRLAQGRMDQQTVYSDDLLVVAERWLKAGARRLHVVDLDGAVQGRPVNAERIRAIVERCADIPVQVGGGIRDEATMESYLEAGARYLILGTRAVSTPQFVTRACAEFSGHILVALDCREGRVATDGWLRLSGDSAADMARRFAEDGVSAFIVTDITRDGMLSSVNAEAALDISRQVSVPVIASGGVRDLEDVRTLCTLEAEGIYGVITGRALYDGTLDLSEAQCLADELCGIT